MKKEVRFIIFIVIIFILILLCSFILKTKSLKYKIKDKDNVFVVNELYNNNIYKLGISINNKKYNFNIYNDLKNNRKIVDKIYYYKDNIYECVLPIINNKVIVDMMCYRDDILYNYHTLVNDNKQLDDYVNKAEEYNIDNYKDNINKYQEKNKIKYFNGNNIYKIIAITNYKGLIINQEEIKLFNNDVYNNKLSTFINKYYIIANYNDNYDFDYFYKVNLETKEIEKINLKNEISFDSYIQGIVDDKIYIYDIDNEIQYEIDVENNKVNQVSTDTVKYYKNNKWETISKGKANKEIYFDYTSLNNYFTDYEKFIETINYYYLFKENNLYKVNKDNIDVKKHILNINNSNINFNDNYLYYKDNDKLYYYSDETGLKTILENKEFIFNNTIKYYIY